MVQVVVVLVYLGVLLGAEVAFTRWERKRFGPAYQAGMVKVRELIDDVEHGRILR